MEDYDLGWQVVFRKSDLFVQVVRTRGEEYVSFRTSTQPPEESIEIESVVFAATGEKVPISGDDSKELQKYLNRIEIYFETEYVKNKESLQVARKEYRENLPPVQVISPKEPEITPILHYTLMGMILLLLLGALITLYMVVLDRLFSAFSLDPNAYRIWMGVVSILLAIGTMLLFWKQRKKRVEIPSPVKAVCQKRSGADELAPLRFFMPFRSWKVSSAKPSYLESSDDFRQGFCSCITSS